MQTENLSSGVELLVTFIENKFADANVLCDCLARGWRNFLRFGTYVKNIDIVFLSFIFNYNNCTKN